MINRPRKLFPVVTLDHERMSCDVKHLNVLSKKDIRSITNAEERKTPTNFATFLEIRLDR